jgi:hypothetical protein
MHPPSLDETRALLAPLLADTGEGWAPEVIATMTADDLVSFWGSGAGGHNMLFLPPVLSVILGMRRAG